MPRGAGLFGVVLLVGVVWACTPSEYEKQTYTALSGQVLPYRVLYPKNYDRSRRYPLVVVLHGSGERGVDNEKQLALGSDLFLEKSVRDRFPAIVVFPQCPPDSFWASVTFDRRTRPYTIEFQANNNLTRPLQAVVDLVQKFKTDGLVDSNRLYLLGLSMGGMGVFETLAHYPDLFAGAVSICGGGNPELADAYARKVKLWIFHGGSDSAVNVAYSRRMVSRLKALKAAVRYTEYPGVDHESWEPTFADPQLLPWLFAQHK